MRYATPLFDSDGKPTQSLLDLLELFHVEHDGTLRTIRDATQDAWYQAGTLRADIKEQHGAKKDQAMPLFEKLGLLGEIRAPRTHYLHALLLGGTIIAVRKRLAFLRSEWERGVRFDTISLLGSERPLKDNETAALYNADNAELPFFVEADQRNFIPATEGGMMIVVNGQARTVLPWASRIETSVVVAPSVDGRNANTIDTLHEWNRLSLTGGRCLVVSSQPFVLFQGIVSRKHLSQRHDVVDCIGSAANPDLPVSTFLDNIAKIVYEIALEECAPDPI